MNRPVSSPRPAAPQSDGQCLPGERVPKVSVVTVCFNAAASIERTIRSVRSQTWAATEHIVIDGASTDGTIDIVRRYADRIATIVSEKDGGIFDAMHKGIARATGDIVYFLNADDSFVDDRVVEDVAAAFVADPSRMLVYGNVILEGAPEGTINYPAKPFKAHSISEFLHNSFCHQAVFARRELFSKLGGFNGEFRYSADYEWIIRAFKACGGRDFFFIDRDIARYYVLGRSAQNMAVTYQEVNRIQAKHFLSLEYLWYFVRYVWLRRLKKRLLNEPGWLLQQSGQKPGVTKRMASGSPGPSSSSPGFYLPTVTVVTVVLNQADVIERTIQSVVEQDYPKVEYIVVDGLSTDGTLDTIRQYESKITQWVSGKDGGPYGGMNRGAAMASGEWIIFMNGGDVFAERNVLTRTFTQCDSATCDVIYGDGIVCGPGYRALERTSPVATLADGNGFSHQASFVRTSLQKEYGFDITEKVAADYDLFLRLRKAGKVFRHVDVVVCEFFLGGVSTLHRDDTIRLRHRVYKKHFPRSEVVLYYRLSVLAAKVVARSLLPRGLWESIKRLSNRGRISALDQHRQGS